MKQQGQKEEQQQTAVTTTTVSTISVDSTITILWLKIL
jgi:hypothetical protein